ncbi:hypothetical protein [Fulvivirga sp.]|uniref:hypothetical protein n=1 Tax=Fulvivirga sp. TaxID=1931237 RepID=UPI0032EECF06
MNLILHIKTCKDAFNFIEPASIKDCQYIDIDNFSDAVMVETVSKSVDLSEKLLVFIQIDGQYELGLLMKVIQKLMKHKRDILFFHSGDHEKLDKMLVLMRSRKIDKADFVSEAVSSFT